jgi:oxygen-dependent protoporphyrinogen oxidase
MPDPAPTLPPIADAVVVGGGIAGLSAALTLAESGAGVVLLESSSRLGGAIDTVTTTTPEGRWLFERGPNTVLGRPPVLDLLAQLGLTDRLLSAAQEAKRRDVWADGTLTPLPMSPPALVATKLLPLSAKLRLLGEPFVGRTSKDDEETVAGFVRRRLGPRVLERMVAPFVSGIYAGDPERLAVRWALPALAEMEAEHGSLLRGAWAARKGSADARPGIVSLPGGLVELVDRLERRLEEAGVVVRRDAPAVDVEPGPGGGFRVRGEEWTVEAGQVVVATDARAAGRLLSGISHRASEAFGEIPHPPLAVVSVGVRTEDVAHPLDGFGFLAARDAGLSILGCLFPSTVFPGRAPAGHAVLSVFVGGRTRPADAELPDDRLVELVRGDLERSLGLRGAPVVTDIARWPRSIPQPEVGHGRFVELAERLEREHPGLALAGNFLGGRWGGPSLPDSISRGLAIP